MAPCDKEELWTSHSAVTKRTSAPQTGKQRSDLVRTNVWFLLDRSGSMSPLVDSVIDSFNAYVDDLKRDFLPHRLTLALSPGKEGTLEFLIDAQRVEDIPPLTRESYRTRGVFPQHAAIANIIFEADEWVEASPQGFRRCRASSGRNTHGRHGRLGHGL